MIGARPLVTNHVEFTCGQEYNTETGEQPEISETASLTAPQPEMVTRSQLTNVTQIFQKSVAISYGKQSNMGTLQGINVAGQQANPMDELAFQVSRRMAKIAQDIEYTFINGKYAKATTDAEANKTRGLALFDTMPTGTAVLFDPSIMAPVHQMVPGKGNFFLEQLAKTGAGETYQIFGQIGLDHGPEWMSAKFTNISTDLPSKLTATTKPGE